MVEYTYDAWGNVLSVTGMYADTLGVNNPIRYRGYYYDFETGFYYLQSRYYDPAIRRFINADGQLNGNSLLGYNLFTYCSNNPIYYVDRTGREAGAELLYEWTTKGWTISYIDGPAPIGEMIYVGGIIVFALYSAIESGVISRPQIIPKFKSIPIPKEKEKSFTIPAQPLDPKFNYWTAEIINNVVTPITPLTYSEARQWVEAGGNLLCRNLGAAIAIVKFYPSARWDPPHDRNPLNGYLPHYHLSSAHTNHIWYY